MNSPFGKKMSEKNPISALQQNAFYAALNDAKEKGKDSFKVGNKTFNVEGSTSAAKMAGSPYHKHGEKFRNQAKELSKDAEQGDYDYDNKKVTDLLAKAKAADARHAEERKAKKNATKVDSTQMAKKDPAPKKKLAT